MTQGQRRTGHDQENFIDVNQLPMSFKVGLVGEFIFASAWCHMVGLPLNKFSQILNCVTFGIKIGEEPGKRFREMDLYNNGVDFCYIEPNTKGVANPIMFEVKTTIDSMKQRFKINSQHEIKILGWENYTVHLAVVRLLYRLQKDQNINDYIEQVFKKKEYRIEIYHQGNYSVEIDTLKIHPEKDYVIRGSDNFVMDDRIVEVSI